MKGPVFTAILKYKNHPSIFAIRYTPKNLSCYKKVIIEKIAKKKNKLSRKKASQSSDTTKRMDKENADISADFLSKSINVSKENYRPVSILSNFIKSF